MIRDTQEYLFKSRPSKPSSNAAKTEANDVLEKLVRELEDSKALNSPSYEGGHLTSNTQLLSIVENPHFQRWIKLDDAEDSGNEDDDIDEQHTRRIVAGPATKWDLRSFCRGLPDYVRNDYCVIHIDCATLAKLCPSGSASESIVCGPLLLCIFKHIVNHQQMDMQQAIARLLETIEEASGLSLFDESDNQHDALERLIQAIEEIGSTRLIQAIADTTHSERHSPKPKRLMIILSGLHHFEKGPVLGRIIYCVQEIQRRLQCYAQYNTLFAYESRKDINYLLGNIKCISDGEPEGTLPKDSSRTTGACRFVKMLNGIIVGRDAAAVILSLLVLLATCCLLVWMRAGMVTTKVNRTQCRATNSIEILIN